MTKIFTIGFFIEKKNGTIWGGDAWKPVPGIRENHPEKSLEFFFKKKTAFLGKTQHWNSKKIIMESWSNALVQQFTFIVLP